MAPQARLTAVQGLVLTALINIFIRHTFAHQRDHAGAHIAAL